MKKVLISLFTIVLIFTLSTVAFAANSPSQEIIPNTSVTVDGVADTVTKVQVTKGQEATVFTFVAPEKDGHVFSSWKITGEYTIVTGGLDQTSITIKVTDPAKSTIVADYTVKKDDQQQTTTGTEEPEDEEPEDEEPDEDKKPSKKPNKGPANDKPTSPDTGSDAFAFFGLTALLAASVAVTAKKRI